MASGATSAPGSTVEPNPRATPSDRLDGLDASHAEFRQKLVRLGIVNNLSTLVTLLIGLVMVPVMLAGLGSRLYGTWLMIVSLNGFILATDLGLNLIVTREAARSGGTGGEAATAVVRAAGGALLLVGVYALLAMTLIGCALEYLPLLARRTAGVGLTVVFVLVGVALLAEQVVQYSVAVLGARMRFGLANAILSSGAALRAALVAAAIVFKPGLIGIACAYAGGALLTATGAAFVVRRVAPLHAVTSFTFNWSVLRPQVRFGLSSALATLAVAILWQVHPLMIGMLVGAPAVAVFSVGMRLPMLVSEMSWRAAEVLFPAVSATEATDDVRRATALSTGVRSLLLIVLPLATMGVALASPILDLWLRDAPEGAAAILRFGALVMLLDACAVPALQVLWGIGRASRIAVMTVAAAGSAVVVNLILLPILGPIAAALAMITGLALQSSVAIAQAARYTGRPLLTLLAKDVAAFVPAAAVCAATATLGRWICEEGDSLLQVAMGGLFGIVGYVGIICVADSTRPEKEALRHGLDVMSDVLHETLGALRRAVKRVEPLRSAWYLLHVLRRRIAYRSSSTSASLDQLFAESPDPWHYQSPTEQGRHDVAEDLVASIHDPSAAERVLEIGCAEGTFTDRLARHSRSLLSVDYSSAALQRARRRRDWGETVGFAQFNLVRDAIPGRFTLVVVMDVLTYFESVSELKAIRAKIVDSLEPGGWLLVGDVRQSEVYERSWWGRRLLCGGLRICEFMARHEQLVQVRQAQTDTHVFRLLRKKT